MSNIIKKVTALFLALVITFIVLPIIPNNTVDAKTNFPLYLETIVDEAYVRAGYTNKYDVEYTFSKGTILIAIDSKINSSKNLWYKVTDMKNNVLGWIFSDRVKTHEHEAVMCGETIVSFEELHQSALAKNTGIGPQRYTLQDVITYRPEIYHVKKIIDNIELCRCGHVVKIGQKNIEFEKHNFNDGYCSACYAIETNFLNRKSPYETISRLLDVCGFIPLVGNFCDVANIGLALANGNYTNAFLNSFSLIPFGNSGRLVLKNGDNVIGIFGRNVVEYGDDVIQTTTAALQDGMRTSSNQALKMAEDYLGTGYKEVANGVFRSSDGLRQVRMTVDDLRDVRGSHFNFETGSMTTTRNGRGTFKVIDNFHIYLVD